MDFSVPVIFELLLGWGVSVVFNFQTGPLLFFFFREYRPFGLLRSQLLVCPFISVRTSIFRFFRGFSHFVCGLGEIFFC